MIGRVETMREDLEYLCQQADMNERCHEVATEFDTKRMASASLLSNIQFCSTSIVFIVFLCCHPFQNSHKSSQSVKEKTLTYFKQLSPEAKQEVYKFYKLDFEMFGYSADEYL